MTDHNELLLNLFSAPSTVNPEEECQLHPSLLTITMESLLSGFEKGRKLLKLLPNEKKMDRQAFLDLANILRTPIMKYCEK